MIHEAGGDVDDVAAAPRQHSLRRPLADVEEARKIGGDHLGVVLRRIVGERLADEYPSIVHEGVDAPKAVQGLGDDPGGDFGFGDVSRDR